MKAMSDRKMDMSRGEPDSDNYFPESAHKRPLPKAGEIRGINYPDTDQQIHSEQNQGVKASNAGRQKEGYRH